MVARAHQHVGQVTAAAFADGSHDQAIIATGTGVRIIAGPGQSWTTETVPNLPIPAVHLSWPAAPGRARCQTTARTPPSRRSPAMAIAPNPTGISVLVGGSNGLVLFSATGGQ